MAFSFDTDFLGDSQSLHRNNSFHKASRPVSIISLFTWINAAIVLAMGHWVYSTGDSIVYPKVFESEKCHVGNMQRLMLVILVVTWGAILLAMGIMILQLVELFLRKKRSTLIGNCCMAIFGIPLEILQIGLMVAFTIWFGSSSCNGAAFNTPAVAFIATYWSTFFVLACVSVALCCVASCVAGFGILLNKA